MILAVTIAKTATLGTLALAIAAAPPLRAGLPSCTSGYGSSRNCPTGGISRSGSAP